MELRGVAAEVGELLEVREEEEVLELCHDRPVPDAEETGDGDDFTADLLVRSEAEYVRLAEQVYTQYAGPQRRHFKWLRSSLFAPQLMHDLLADSRSLIGVLEHCRRWDPTKDAKLRALVDLIQLDHPNDKILVFSQFADTVAYLTDQLARLGVTRLAGVTAESADPTRLAWRFSPRSNGKRSWRGARGNSGS